MADPTVPTVSTATIKERIGNSQYITLNDGGGDSVATNALNQSRILCKSKFDKSDLDFDETEAYTADAVINMACYYLFYRNNQVKAGNHYKKIAMELLKSVLGNDALGESEVDKPSMPGLSVADENPWIYGDSSGNGSYSRFNRY